MCRRAARPASTRSRRCDASESTDLYQPRRVCQRPIRMKHILVALLLAAQAGVPTVALAKAGPRIFTFEADGFWLNLHHFLYVLSRAQAGTPDSKRAAVINAPIDQEDGLNHLSDAERKVWTDAVTFYANGPGKM